jgi:hypothetical protein
VNGILDHASTGNLFQEKASNEVALKSAVKGDI